MNGKHGPGKCFTTNSRGKKEIGVGKLFSTGWGGVCVRKQNLGGGDEGERGSERTRKFINLFALDVIGTELHLRCPKYALE